MLDDFAKAIVFETFFLIIITWLLGWKWLLLIMPAIAGLIALKLWKPEISRNIIPFGMLAIIAIIIAMNASELKNNMLTPFSTTSEQK